MKIKCLLIDDEPPALKILQNYISNVKGFEIVGMCKNAIEALDVIHDKTVDLIFLDIKMPKLLGTEFIKSLAVPPMFIFVTAYRDYAADSYELDAVDYLVKPVSFERFMKSISRVKKLMGHTIQEQTHTYSENPAAFVYLKVDKNMQKILINEIQYIESWRDYVKVYLTTGKTFLVRQSISSIENLLSEHSFLRVHRSYMVSIKKISGYNHATVQLGSLEIPIGRLYKQHVLDVINTR
ncbi:LytR/AlgR family response regulator transcription factor [Flavihumibacter profundi]|jgi:DNA-binding LytR/AlgR family response regulator|uniref:LytR/AlgR family response regulator transcription factor n=1 Tax=Flavihumibacter profundi TaxID=2716883 RepID=UPI001CC3746D|nr:LytTR family DNA-binding domain-containing protein [Flavihumibacter profundi]MBZ5857288.1 LytTR family DNA-binding domain-containing protein [Flavihumibacter profundi]